MHLSPASQGRPKTCFYSYCPVFSTAGFLPITPQLCSWMSGLYLRSDNLQPALSSFSKRSYCLCCHRYSNIWSYSELTVHRNECSTELGQRPTLLWSSQSCLCLWPGTSAGLEVYMADPPDARTGLKVPPVGTRLKRGSVVSHLMLTFTSYLLSVLRKSCVPSFLSSFSR